MFDRVKSLVDAATSIVIIQAENPDGDSLGSAVALEELLSELGKEVTMYCPVDTPKYLRYISGWDRVTTDFNTSVDLAIIVDTSADVLLGKTLETPGVRAFFESHPVLVLDHHITKSTLTFEHEMISSDVVATGELILDVALELNWPITPQAAENMLIAIMSDSLGLTTQNTTAKTFESAAKLTKLGASNSAIELRRREYMKKSPEILAYKGELIGRIEYFLEGKLGFVHIPWEEIREYSDQYNPSMLVLDEMRLVEGVEVTCAVKTYPDGKVTGKIRANTPVADVIAGYFGGGGHAYAAGFRAYDSYDTIVKELLTATQKALADYELKAK
jgi:phosphoesterase RecJ-like protein